MMDGKKMIGDFYTEKNQGQIKDFLCRGSQVKFNPRARRVANVNAKHVTQTQSEISCF